MASTRKVLLDGATTARVALDADVSAKTIRRYLVGTPVRGVGRIIKALAKHGRADLIRVDEAHRAPPEAYGLGYMQGRGAA